MQLFLASALSLIMAVFIFIGVIKDTEVDVGLRAEFGRKRTLDKAGCIDTLRTTLLPRFRFFALTSE